jgi:tRNA modification GTPase
MAAAQELVMQDTIYGLASGIARDGRSAVAVTRISGPDVKRTATALSIPIDRLVAKPRTSQLCYIRHPLTHAPIDQALVTLFQQPRSFTGQDVLEIHGHGGRASIRGLLDALASLHPLVRLAEPGEFSRRYSKLGICMPHHVQAHNVGQSTDTIDRSID